MYLKYFEFLKNHGICFVPSLLLTSEKFMRAHYKEMGLDVDEMFEYVKWENQARRYENETLPTDYKIPFISHAIWVTNPANPKEMLDKVEADILNPFFNSFKALE